jgi:hypothetical protein
MIIPIKLMRIVSFTARNGQKTGISAIGFLGCMQKKNSRLGGCSKKRTLRILERVADIESCHMKLYA